MQDRARGWNEATAPAQAMALELANAPQDEDRREACSQNEVCGGEQHGPAPAICLHGVFTAAGTGRCCGTQCYPQWMVVSFVGSIAPANPFELAVAWPMLTVDVASALFDSAWNDRGG